MQWLVNTHTFAKYQLFNEPPSDSKKYNSPSKCGCTVILWTIFQIFPLECHEKYVQCSTQMFVLFITLECWAECLLESDSGHNWKYDHWSANSKSIIVECSPQDFKILESTTTCSTNNPPRVAWDTKFAILCVVWLCFRDWSGLMGEDKVARPVLQCDIYCRFGLRHHHHHQ